MKYKKRKFKDMEEEAANLLSQLAVFPLFDIDIGKNISCYDF